MARVVLEVSEQQHFFRSISLHSQLSSNELGKLLGISGRSYRDWVKGETLPTIQGIQLLSSNFNVPIPTIIDIRDEHWTGKMYGKKAALIKNKIYGPPGTAGGRKKGGTISQIRRKQFPDKYRQLGCIVRNNFSAPIKSQKLSEFIGIILGDGCITMTQCHVTLHAVHDKKYAQYVQQLTKSLFGYIPNIISRKGNAIEVVINGVNFTQLLNKYGLREGNKVLLQVAPPHWIMANQSFLKACIRGLFDTDGGVVVHRHKIRGRQYVHLNLCFSNHSRPLLEIFLSTLQSAGIKSSINKHCVMIYNIAGIKKFFTIFRPSNPKHWERLKNYMEVSDSGQFETPGKR